VKRWFADLEPRERFFLLGGAAIAAVIVAWGLIWNPMTTRNVELTDSVATKQRMLATLQRARAVAAPAGQPQLVDASTRQSLVLLIDQTHRSYGLDGTLVRNQPDGADGIRVTFQNASFDGLVAWLGTLQGSYAVAVETASQLQARDAGPDHDGIDRQIPIQRGKRRPLEIEPERQTVLREVGRRKHRKVGWAVPTNRMGCGAGCRSFDLDLHHPRIGSGCCHGGGQTASSCCKCSSGNSSCRLATG